MATFGLIDGNQRSGTNLLCHLLDGHPDLRVFPDEFGMVTDLYNPRNQQKLDDALSRNDTSALFKVLFSFGTFQRYQDNARKGFLPPAKGSFGKKYDFRFDFQLFLKKMEDQLNQESTWNRWVVCRAAFEAFWEAWLDRPFSNPDALILVKNHEAGLYLDELLDEASDLKVLHLVRNPMDFMISQKVRYSKVHLWTQKRFKKNVLRWKKMKTDLQRYPKNVFAFRFEDLVKEQSAWIAKSCQFLAISSNEPVLEKLTIGGKDWVSNTAFRKVDPTQRAKKQIKELSWGEFRYLRDQLRELMVKWEYEVPSYPVYNIPNRWAHDRISFAKQKAHRLYLRLSGQRHLLR